MKINKYFDIKEVISPNVYAEYGDEALQFLDTEAIDVLENIREILGVPLICNNWYSGGTRKYCGYREPECKVGSKNSWHKKGKAFDLVSTKMSAAEMRDKLEENKDLLIRPIRVEKWDGDEEIAWLHFDLGNTKGQKIYFFSA